jgi:NDP-sugar pyrophosphorylase family protein
MTNAAAPDLHEAIILAGGRGTRLAPVLRNQQKVTADVGGTPFIERLVRWLGTFGVERVVLAAGYRAVDLEALLLTANSRRQELALSIETEPLGTAGAARLAAEQTSANPLLVLNGDSIAEIDLESFFRFHRTSRARASVVLVPAPGQSRYGFVETAPDGAILRFHEKPDGPQAGGWINGGIYLFERAALDEIPIGHPVSLEREVFPRLIGRGLYGKHFDVRFIDIGTPESLAGAGSFFSERTQ